MTDVVSRQLEVDFEPICIYKNGEFTKDKYKDKYSDLLESEDIQLTDNTFITKEKRKFLRI